MPLSSISNVISICGTPRGALECPQDRIGRAPCCRRPSRARPGHPNRHGSLVVLGRRKHLALLRRDGRVAIDQAREHAAQRLDAKGKRRHVEQEHVLDVPLQNAGLDCGADRDDLVRVDVAYGAPCRRTA